MNLIINLILFGFSLFMLYRIFNLSRRGKENKKMLAILDHIDDPDTFFAEADQFIETEKNPEFVQKVSVLRLWGDTFYERDEAFKQHLEALNVETLLNPDGKNKGFDNNEDSFFYLYMAIPNRLYFRGQEELRTYFHEKLSAYDEVNANRLLKKIYDENRKYYAKTDDKGIPFIRSFLEGDYGGYKYSKQLIGLYKNCEETLLARYYLDENDTEKYEICMNEIESFAKNTRLGMRWLKEAGLSYPESDEETVTEEETEGVTKEETGEEAPVSEPETAAETEEKETAE